MLTRRTLASVAVAAAFAAPSVQPCTAQDLGDSEVVAATPATGFPEGITTRGRRFYISGPANFGMPLGSAYVQSYHTRTGNERRHFPVTIVNPHAGMSAASCITFGPDGALYLIEPFVGVIRMELDHANSQSVYAEFPPAEASLLNDLDFDLAGNLYVTDTFGAKVFRIPAGGGDPEVWFSDPAFAGHPEFPFGVNGIRVDHRTNSIYVSVTVDATFNGVIYRLPLVDSPDAADLEVFANLGATGPDGIEFSRSGNLYVAQALSNTITVLNPDGSIQATYAGPADDPDGGTVEWANPANLAFDRRGNLLVTNHAHLVPFDPSLFVIFNLHVGERGRRR